jgi:hypothetical protein
MANTAKRKTAGRRTWSMKEGEWKEKKLAPDRWEFTYSAPQRRTVAAPAESGAPPGTDFHWLIVAQQDVQKVDANTYRTSMTGLKFKIAPADRAHRRRLIQILEELIADLSRESVEKEYRSSRRQRSGARLPKPVGMAVAEEASHPA